MSSWRDRLAAGTATVQEMSAENMAASRIMRSMGATTKDIGKLCSRFGIAYREDESIFVRAISIFREVYSAAQIVPIFDVKNGKCLEDAIDDLTTDSRSAIIFFRIDRTKDREAHMTALVRDQNLATSPIGQLVIRPGIRYIACKNDVQLWEQEPVALLRSFGTNN